MLNDKEQWNKDTESSEDCSCDEATVRKNQSAIALLLVACFVLMVSAQFVTVAIPILMRDFRVDPLSVQWVRTASLVSVAATVPTTGFILQRFSTRQIFSTAMLLFILGSLLSGVAPTLPALIVGRIVQAGGTALMLPLLVTMIMAVVPPGARGKIFGKLVAVMALGPSMGPPMSGLILRELSWRWLFLLVVPVAATVLIVGLVRLKNIPLNAARKMPLDILSVFLSVPAFGLLVYGLAEIRTVSANPVERWLPVALGVGALALFVVRQILLQKAGRALVDLRTFACRGFAAAIAAMSLYMAEQASFAVLLAIYVQNVLHYSAFVNALLLMPGSVLMGLIAPCVGRYHDRNGPFPLLLTGSLIVCAVLWTMTRLGDDTPVWMVALALTTLSLGGALLYTPLVAAGLENVRPDLYSYGSAIVGTVSDLMGAVGTVILVGVMASREQALVAHGISNLSATVGGIRTAFVYGAGISMIVIPLVWFLRRAKPVERIQVLRIHE